MRLAKRSAGPTVLLRLKPNLEVSSRIGRARLLLAGHHIDMHAHSIHRTRSDRTHR